MGCFQSRDTELERLDLMVSLIELGPERAHLGFQSLHSRVPPPPLSLSTCHGSSVPQGGAVDTRFD